MTYNPYSLHQKKIFITGASSGIGRATAIECSKSGASVIITARNKERLEETFSMLEGEGHVQQIADLTISNEVTKLIGSLPEIDGFVCNAGITKILPVSGIKEKDLNKTLQINTVAPILLTRHLLKGKKIKRGSSIVYLSSIAGVYNSSPGNAMYSASKGAINAFMKNAALEFASKGIRCNSVNPGMVRTAMIENGKISEEQLKTHEEKYPLKRFGQPEDIAYAIIYLLSEASSWMTGTSLLIDGGFTLN